MSMRRTILVLAVVAALTVAGATLVWRLRSRTGGACGDPTQDPLDARSLQHSLPGAPPVVYWTEPPTSGPHQPGLLSGGVVTEPLAGPVQVGALEGGQVLLQHRDLAVADRMTLEALGGALVVVAPNPALPTPVVASAWRTRQLCQSVDVDALGRFVREHAGRHPAHQD